MPLIKSSNKSLVWIIRKLLETNEKSWDSKLKFSLWANRVTDKRSIGNSPFKLVYGSEAIFPIQPILLVEKFFQEEEDEPNDMMRRMMDLVELQQIKEQVAGKSEAHKQRINGMFDKRTKADNFQVGDWVLKWDAVRKEKGKHKKFDSLWIGPFVIDWVYKNNTLKLQNLEGEEVFDAQ